MKNLEHCKCTEIRAIKWDVLGQQYDVSCDDEVKMTVSLRQGHGIYLNSEEGVQIGTKK